MSAQPSLAALVTRFRTGPPLPPELRRPTAHELPRASAGDGVSATLRDSATHQRSLQPATPPRSREPALWDASPVSLRRSAGTVSSLLSSAGDGGGEVFVRAMAVIAEARKLQAAGVLHGVRAGLPVQPAVSASAGAPRPPAAASVAPVTLPAPPAMAATAYTTAQTPVLSTQDTSAAPRGITDVQATPLSIATALRGATGAAPASLPATPTLNRDSSQPVPAWVPATQIEMEPAEVTLERLRRRLLAAELASPVPSSALSEPPLAVAAHSTRGQLLPNAPVTSAPQSSIESELPAETRSREASFVPALVHPPSPQTPAPAPAQAITAPSQTVLEPEDASISEWALSDDEEDGDAGERCDGVGIAGLLSPVDTNDNAASPGGGRLTPATSPSPGAGQDGASRRRPPLWAASPPRVGRLLAGGGRGVGRRGEGDGTRTDLGPASLDVSVDRSTISDLTEGDSLAGSDAPLHGSVPDVVGAVVEADDVVAHPAAVTGVDTPSAHASADTGSTGASPEEQVAPSSVATIADPAFPTTEHAASTPARPAEAVPNQPRKGADWALQPAFTVSVSPTPAICAVSDSAGAVRNASAPRIAECDSLVDLAGQPLDRAAGDRSTSATAPALPPWHRPVPTQPLEPPVPPSMVAPPSPWSYDHPRIATAPVGTWSWHKHPAAVGPVDSPADAWYRDGWRASMLPPWRGYPPFPAPTFTPAQPSPPADMYGAPAHAAFGVPAPSPWLWGYPAPSWSALQQTPVPAVPSAGGSASTVPSPSMSHPESLALPAPLPPLVRIPRRG